MYRYARDLLSWRAWFSSGELTPTTAPGVVSLNRPRASRFAT
jgi:hypothetical protein